DVQDGGWSRIHWSVDGGGGWHGSMSVVGGIHGWISVGGRWQGTRFGWQWR
ncbi:hypothetical protein PanWU01x14_232560, partial [Parasponia andersonii]